ncbi:phage Gp37/Gp68 family protein [Myxococcus sp. NMCA1]|uniref:phage Gp37/Gp68 family protein n=1 Tax=Myxococcus sp. NMCA1 TaxID=2996785 RepID=UPI00228605ED|nr:phage Gp37/Gp68 family protein [Myxococcus sp. NMCA1]WAM23779.1 phage Gp37/Gp68 family protein [Myxococcus sp. NMCA1]
MAETAIEWTDVVWNVTKGCSRKSPGCGGGTSGPRKGGCYAERMAIRLAGPGQPYEGLVESTPTGPRWTGKVVLDEELLDAPLRWKKPRRVFVNSMSDLFHESLSFETIDRVFATMRLAERHTFQVLTKRADRMREYVEWARARSIVEGLEVVPGRPITWERAHPNVWLGVSVEDQRRADERIPHLLATPAAVRFLSCEPLLGPVDLERYLKPTLHTTGGERLQHPDPRIPSEGGRWEWGVSWVITGGESGPGARPMHPEWARRLRDQCVSAGVPFFFKQWGAWAVRDYLVHGDIPKEPVMRLGEHGRDTRDLANVLDAGAEVYMQCVGKKAAGRVLDGRTWDEFPGEVASG